MRQIASRALKTGCVAISLILGALLVPSSWLAVGPAGAAPLRIGFLEVSNIEAVHVHGDNIYLLQQDTLHTADMGAIRGSVGLEGFHVASVLSYPHLYVAEAQSCVPFSGTCTGWEGVEIIDVGDPGRPRVVRSLPLSGIAGLYLSGSRLCVARDREIRIVDITAPAAAAVVGTVALQGTFQDLGFTGDLAVAVENRYCTFFNSGCAGLNGLEVINLANPASPSVLRSLALAPVDQAMSIWDLFVSGDLAYLGHSSGRLDVVDLGMPARARVVGSLDLQGAFPEFALDPPYLYVRERESCTGFWGSGVCEGLNGIEIVDVGDPEAPASRGTTAVPWIRDLGVRGSFAFVSGENVLEVLDLGNPTAPSPAGSITLLGYFSQESEAVYTEGLAYVEVSRRCTNPFDSSSCTGSSGLEIIDISPSSCASLNPVTAILHIPCFDSDMGALWVDLRLVSFSPILFELDDFGRTARTGGGCASLNPRSGTLHVPCVSYRSNAFSLDLAVRPGLPVRLEVVAVGAVSP